MRPVNIDSWSAEHDNLLHWLCYISQSNTSLQIHVNLNCHKWHLKVKDNNHVQGKKKKKNPDQTSLIIEKVLG